MKPINLLYFLVSIASANEMMVDKAGVEYPVVTVTEKYKTKIISKTKWMAVNMNYSGPQGFGRCVNNDEENCKKYGRIYTWAEAKKVCPKNWHLSENSDWSQLISASGGSDSVGLKIKAKNEWGKIDTLITGEFGLNMLPGGYAMNDGDHGVGESVFYWVYEPSNPNLPTNYYLLDDRQTISHYQKTNNLKYVIDNEQRFYVRCVEGDKSDASSISPLD